MVIIEVKGLEELEAKLLELADLSDPKKATNAVLVKAAKNAMEPVLQQVIATAPVGDKPRDAKNPFHMRDTAKLVARRPTSGDYKSTFVSQTDVAIAVVSVKKSAVSLAQEFGTSKIAGKPFLRRALEQNKDQVISLFKTDFQDYLREFWGKVSRRRK